MPTIGFSEQRSPLTNDEWIADLRAAGPRYDAAVRDLHELMLRGARHQVARMRATTPELTGVLADDLVHQAADEAVVAVLGKLDTFEGRSRFTTWAFKFAILQTAAEVRRTAWRNREVPVEVLPEAAATGASPVQVVEGSDFAAAVARAMDTELTDRQRTVAVALLLDDVPIDVLAERLGTNRNALYKTLHDARGRLRRKLTEERYLPEQKKARDAR